MINWPVPEQSCGMAAQLLAQARKQLPAIDRILERYKSKSLHDYLGELSYNNPQPLQEPDDLLEALCNYIAPILGERLAADLSHDLKNYPVILTANHHGVDYFAQSFQGNLLFLLYRRIFTGDSNMAPIFSCGGVPLSNSSYPKGILLYDAIQPDSGELPFRLPVFPNNLNQTVVHAAPRFHEELVNLVLRQLEKSFTRKLISRRAFETTGELLSEEYLNPEVLNLPDYSAQATFINNRLGKKIIKREIPELVYIEFESITSLVLKKDLNNQDSLIHRIFFDPDLRKEVIKNLNGKKGCWDLEKLMSLNKGTLAVDTGFHLLAGFGSIFFWGIDVLGRRYPLTIIDCEAGEPYLAGIDGLGTAHRIQFNPRSILAALESKLIYPNLFTIFTVISLARGVACIGGYFQSDYLPAIQKGLVQALNSIGEYRSDAEIITGVATHYYLSGMMFILAGIGRQFAVPAGPIEIISRGGLKNTFLEELKSISLNSAHQIGLFSIYADLFSRQNRIKQWQVALAFELNRENSQWVLPEIP